MDTRVVNYFLEVVNQGNMTKAGYIYHDRIIEMIGILEFS